MWFKCACVTPSLPQSVFFWSALDVQRKMGHIEKGGGGDKPVFIRLYVQFHEIDDNWFAECLSLF